MADGALPEKDEIDLSLDFQRLVSFAAWEKRLLQLSENDVSGRKSLDEEAQVALLIVDCMKAGSADVINRLAGDLAIRMRDDQRALLAVVLLRSLPEDLVQQVFECFASPSSTIQGLTVDDHKSNAEWWAAGASQVEIRAFVAAGIKRMHPDRREAMRQWLNGGAK